MNKRKIDVETSTAFQLIIAILVAIGFSLFIVMVVDLTRLIPENRIVSNDFETACLGFGFSSAIVLEQPGHALCFNDDGETQTIAWNGKWVKTNE